MKILGIGIDIVEKGRIKQSIKKSQFIKRIFSKKEILNSKYIKDKSSFYLKRFAAKEAFVKSLGTGFRKGLNFKDIAVINDNLGKPYFLINNQVKELIKKRFKVNKYNFFLSISDEKKYSIAIVIFQI